jgi:arylsulfatase A-like enzyme
VNVIIILCDTVVRDKLSPYHRGDGPYGYIQTPNIDAFARRAVRFDNHWINSAPCMPARRDLWSGRIEFPWRSWGPRESFDPDWTLLLRQTDVTTALFTDHANLMDVGAGNYHHHFDHYEFVRGHFNDHCATTVPIEPGRRGMTHRIYAQMRAAMCDESDTYVAQNLSNVARWLDDNHASNRPFFLFVDEFDPHWPLDPPEPYRSMYLEDKSLAEKSLTTSYHGSQAEDYTDEELIWLNAQAAGKITLVDRWLGEVFDRLDRYALWDDTLVVLTTDHGEFIGEYGQMSKGHGFSYPLFARIPLLVHMPGSPLTGGATGALTCTVDLHATALDFLGQTVSEHCHGVSLLRLLRGETTEHRRDVIYGWWGKGFYWSDGHMLLCKAPEGAGPLYQYGTDFGEKWVGLRGDYFDRHRGIGDYSQVEVGPFLPHTDRPVYRVPYDGLAYSSPDADLDALFDLDTDEDCQYNLFDTDLTRRNAAVERLVRSMASLQVPGEHYRRLGLDG